MLTHLAPYKVGRYGQLMEWSKDIDDPKDEHRHVNHLFGLHPGHTLSPITTPDLAKAARVVLEHRGDGATGWSMGWKLNQWARLQDGNHAYKLFGNLLKRYTGQSVGYSPAFPDRRKLWRYRRYHRDAAAKSHGLHPTIARTSGCLERRKHQWNLRQREL